MKINHNMKNYSNNNKNESEDENDMRLISENDKSVYDKSVWNKNLLYMTMSYPNINRMMLLYLETVDVFQMMKTDKVLHTCTPGKLRSLCIPFSGLVATWKSKQVFSSVTYLRIELETKKCYCSDPITISVEQFPHLKTVEFVSTHCNKVIIESPIDELVAWDYAHYNSIQVPKTLRKLKIRGAPEIIQNALKDQLDLECIILCIASLEPTRMDQFTFEQKKLKILEIYSNRSFKTFIHSLEHIEHLDLCTTIYFIVSIEEFAQTSSLRWLSLIGCGPGSIRRFVGDTKFPKLNYFALRNSFGKSIDKDGFRIYHECIERDQNQVAPYMSKTMSLCTLQSYDFFYCNNIPNIMRLHLENITAKQSYTMVHKLENLYHLTIYELDGSIIKITPCSKRLKEICTTSFPKYLKTLFNCFPETQLEYFTLCTSLEQWNLLPHVLLKKVVALTLNFNSNEEPTILIEDLPYLRCIIFGADLHSFRLLISRAPEFRSVFIKSKPFGHQQQPGITEYIIKNHVLLSQQILPQQF